MGFLAVCLKTSDTSANIFSINHIRHVSKLAGPARLVFLPFLSNIRALCIPPQIMP